MLHRFWKLFGMIFGVAVAASVIITVLWRGVPILAHGVIQCRVLYQNHMLEQFLYSTCGCAFVLAIAFFGSVLALYIWLPIVVHQIRGLHRLYR